MVLTGLRKTMILTDEITSYDTMQITENITIKQTA